MFRLTRPKDEYLVRRATAGHREAFEALIRRHLPAVRALAYAHTGNFADAEDVAQETCFKAMQALDGLREPSKFGAWLMGIARNTSNRLQASRARERQVLEEFPAKSAVLPDVERRELRAAVRKRLDDLDEPHREVILLHYFAGHRVKEIAALLDISAEAARKRLQRAREDLGALLLTDLCSEMGEKASSKRESAAIIAALAAVPYPWQGASPTGAAATGGVWGGIASTKSIAIAGTTTVLVVTAATMAVLRSGGESPTASSRRLTPVNAASAGDEASPHPNTTRKSVATGTFLAGYVRDPQGRPVEGATVKIADYARVHETRREPEFRSTVTGGDGTFRFEGLSASKEMMVRAEKAGMVTPTTEAGGGLIMQGNLINLPAGGRSDIALKLYRQSRIRGYVTDSYGRRLANEDVTATLVDYTVPPSAPLGRLAALAASARNPIRYEPTESTRTGLQGEFEIDGLLPGKHILVLAPEHQRFGLKDGEVHLKEGETVEGVHLTLSENPLCISGKVVDEKGRPVEGVFVQAPGFRSVHATTGSDGAYRLTRLAESTYAIHVFHDDYEHVGRYGVAAGSENVDFVLTSRGEKSVVSGRVVDAAKGTPLVDFEILALEGRIGVVPPGQYRAFSRRNDGQGRFEIGGVPAGTATLVARASGYATAFCPVDVPSGKRVDGLTISLSRGGVVEGRTVSGTGAAVVNALVFVGELTALPAGMPNPGELLASLAATRSDAEGRFRLDSLAAGSQVLSAYSPHEGRGSLSVQVTDKPLTGVSIVLGQTGAVTGRVTVAGEPAEGVTVFATLPGGLGRTLAESKTNADGSYTLTDLQPADTGVTAVVSSSRSNTARRQLRTVTVTASAATEASFDFPAAEGSVEGLVTVLGAPPKHGQARLEIMLNEGGTEEQILQFGEDGHYRIEQVPVGSGTLQISASPAQGSIRGKALAVEVNGPETVRVDVDFPGKGVIGGQLDGIAPTENGTVIALEGTVQLSDMSPSTVAAIGPSARGTVVSDENGSFTMDGLEPGTYTFVGLAAPSRGPDSLNRIRFTSAVVEVSPQAPGTITLSLAP